MAGDLLDEHAVRAARAYGAAADHYLLPALGFWDRFGAATVARLPLLPGDEVLDLCCGAGASAIPAARTVTTAGRVVAVDVAQPLLEAAKARAANEGLANLDFRLCDARSTGLPDASFDAVICVFGVFFARDVETFVAEMWRLVRPGGTLAITTWGEALFEPADRLFWETVAELSPTLYKSFHPWDEITTPERLVGLFNRAGIDKVMVEAIRGSHPLADPEDFWHIALGTGYRATVDALEPDQRRVLHSKLLTRLGEQGIDEVRTDVVYGVARRE
jgi:ubiquinone/menaquinone biosynthesis C-methylase UbiE